MKQLYSLFLVPILILSSILLCPTATANNANVGGAMNIDMNVVSEYKGDEPSSYSSSQTPATINKYAEIEEALYQSIQEGVCQYAGIDFDAESNTIRKEDYIDISEFGLFNSDEVRQFVRSVYRRFYYDHPECFYLSGGSPIYQSGGILVGIRPEYYNFQEYYGIENSPGQMKELKAELETVVDNIVSEALEQTDPVDQLLVLHDRLAEGLCYDWEIGKKALYREEYGDTSDKYSPSRGAYSALVKKNSVCTGIARAFQLLIERLYNPRIQCITIYNDTGRHVWNMVSLDGRWYHMDVNAAINGIPSTRGILRHHSFMISDERMTSYGYIGKHTYSSLSTEWDTLPDCNDHQYESGWAFEDVRYLMIPQSDGKFYYIRQNAVYLGPLKGEGVKLLDITLPNVVSGVVWQFPLLYYIDRDFHLVCYHLESGRQSILGDIPFTAEEPIRYTKEGDESGTVYSIADGISLYLDSSTGNIVAAHRLSSHEIVSFSPNARFVTGGNCGENLTWTFHGDGVLSIEGSGKMDDYNFDERTGMLSAPAWYAYRQYIDTLHIDEGVTSVGNWAFYNLTALKVVHLPQSLAELGDSAFNHCEMLASIQLPDRIEIISPLTFYKCVSLKDVLFPSDLHTIGARAFLNCSALTQVTIPAQCSRIESYAFHESGLKHAYFMGDGPEYIFVLNNQYHSFDENVTLYYLKGRSGWTTDKYYVQESSTWRGYKLSCYGNVEGGFYLRRTGTDYDAGYLAEKTVAYMLILATYDKEGRMADVRMITIAPSNQNANSLFVSADSKISKGKLFILDPVHLIPQMSCLEW